MQAKDPTLAEWPAERCDACGDIFPLSKSARAHTSTEKANGRPGHNAFTRCTVQVEGVLVGAGLQDDGRRITRNRIRLVGLADLPPRAVAAAVGGAQADAATQAAAVAAASAMMRCHGAATADPAAGRPPERLEQEKLIEALQITEQGKTSARVAIAKMKSWRNYLGQAEIAVKSFAALPDPGLDLVCGGKTTHKVAFRKPSPELLASVAKLMAFASSEARAAQPMAELLFPVLLKPIDAIDYFREGGATDGCLPCEVLLLALLMEPRTEARAMIMSLEFARDGVLVAIRCIYVARFLWLSHRAQDPDTFAQMTAQMLLNEPMQGDDAAKSMGPQSVLDHWCFRLRKLKAVVDARPQNLEAEQFIVTMNTQSGGGLCVYNQPVPNLLPLVLYNGALDAADREMAELYRLFPGLEQVLSLVSINVVDDAFTNTGTRTTGRCGEHVPFLVQSEEVHERLSRQICEVVWLALERAKASSPAEAKKLSKSVTGSVAALQTNLALAMHVSGGGPPRITDLEGLRVTASHDLGPRTLFFLRGHGAVSVMRNSKVEKIVAHRLAPLYRGYPHRLSQVLLHFAFGVRLASYMVECSDDPAAGDQLAKVFHGAFFIYHGRIATAEFLRRALAGAIRAALLPHGVTVLLGVREYRHYQAEAVDRFTEGDDAMRTVAAWGPTAMDPLMSHRMTGIPNAIRYFLLNSRRALALQGGRSVKTFDSAYARKPEAPDEWTSLWTLNEQILASNLWQTWNEMPLPCRTGYGLNRVEPLVETARSHAAKAQLRSGAARAQLLAQLGGEFKCASQEQMLQIVVSECLGGTWPAADRQAPARARGKNRIIVCAAASGKTAAIVALATVNPPLVPGVVLVLAPLTAVAIQTVARCNSLLPNSAMTLRDLAQDPHLSRAVFSAVPGPTLSSIRLLVTTPEAVMPGHSARGLVLQLARRLVVSLIIVDDVHCVSECGPEFRSGYAVLYNSVLEELLKEFGTFGPPPVVGLTATCLRSEDQKLLTAVFGPNAREAVVDRVASSIVRTDLSLTFHGVSGGPDALFEELTALVLGVPRGRDVVITCKTDEAVNAVCHHLVEALALRREAGAMTNVPFATGALWLAAASSDKIVQFPNDAARLDAAMATRNAEHDRRIVVGTSLLAVGVSWPNVHLSVVLSCTYGAPLLLQAMYRAGRNVSAGVADAPVGCLLFSQAPAPNMLSGLAVRLDGVGGCIRQQLSMLFDERQCDKCAPGSATACSACATAAGGWSPSTLLVAEGRRQLELLRPFVVPSVAHLVQQPAARATEPARGTPADDDDEYYFMLYLAQLDNATPSPTAQRREKRPEDDEAVRPFAPDKRPRALPPPAPAAVAMASRAPVPLRPAAAAAAAPPGPADRVRELVEALERRVRFNSVEDGELWVSNLRASMRGRCPNAHCPINPNEEHMPARCFPPLCYNCGRPRPRVNQRDDRHAHCPKPKMPAGWSCFNCWWDHPFGTTPHEDWFKPVLCQAAHLAGVSFLELWKVMWPDTLKPTPARFEVLRLLLDLEQVKPWFRF